MVSNMALHILLLFTPWFYILTILNVPVLHIIISTYIQVLHIIAYILRQFGDDRIYCSPEGWQQRHWLWLTPGIRRRLQITPGWKVWGSTRRRPAGVCVSCAGLGTGQRVAELVVVVVVGWFWSQVIGNRLNGWSQSVSATGSQIQKSTQGCIGV